jgi:hypothetical protein
MVHGGAATGGIVTAHERQLLLDLRERLLVIALEAEHGDPDDVVRVIATGGVEDVDRLLGEERAA